MKKSMKKLTAAIYTVLATTALGIGSVNAYAIDSIDDITTWGESLISDIQKIGEIIGVGAIIVLAIMCMTAGRGWAEKLKSGAAGIIIGICLLGFGTSIVAGLFEGTEDGKSANSTKKNITNPISVVTIAEE